MFMRNLQEYNQKDDITAMYCQSSFCGWLRTGFTGQPRRLIPGDPFGGLCSACYLDAFFRAKPHLRSTRNSPPCGKCGLPAPDGVGVWISKDEKQLYCGECVKEIIL